MSAPIEVLEVRRVDAGNLKAFAKVRLGAVIIHGCRVIQQSGQKPWASLPQQPARKKADGSGPGWFPVVEITRKELLDQVKAAILEAYEARTAVHRTPPRQDARQSATEEWAARFDEHGPDSEPPF